VWLVVALLCGVPGTAGAEPAPDSLRAVTVQDASPVGSTASPAPERWFYNGLPYGSESLVHPLRLIYNGGFGTLQFDRSSNRLGDVNFPSGWHRVWADLGNPGRAIRAVGGWGELLSHEVVPFTTDPNGGQYWPNYTLHLVGGGMSFTMMREWYEMHGVAHPRWCAGGTMAAYHLLNEFVENDDCSGPTVDAIADVYLFNPVGVLLFSHDGVNRFFSRRLHLRDWSTQPAITPGAWTAENQGQNFSIKVGLPRSDRWSAFYYFGNHGEVGLSYTRPNGSAFSAGAGLQASALKDIDKGMRTVDLVPSFGFFYDRNGSLLFSVTSATSSRYGVRVNAYPGLLKAWGRTAGLFALWDRDDRIILGIHLREFPIGLASR
jgi:hypothetical protein